MDPAAIAQRQRLLAKSIPDVFHLRNVLTGEQGVRNFYGAEGKAEAKAEADHRNRFVNPTCSRWAVCLSVEVMKPGWVEADEAPAAVAPVVAAAVATEDDQSAEPAQPVAAIPAKRTAAKSPKRKSTK